jgi:DeoR/GlpR family transcriptional regulator of sugar metabolism
MIEGLTVQKAILSVAGIDSRGYYNSNLLLVETERAMMRCADQTIVVADSSKFGRSSLARLCGLGDVRKIVVDDELDQSWRDRLTEHNVETIVAARKADDDVHGSIPAPHVTITNFTNT